MVVDSAVAALRQADIVVITTPDPAFHTLKAVDFLKPGGMKVVLIVGTFWPLSRLGRRT
jgi:hypothetical protein